MTCLIDASSIYDSIGLHKIGLITEYSTLEIARYEIGNILWKHTFLFNTYSQNQSLEMLKVLTQAFDRMQFFSIKNSEEEILELSLQLELSYYDSAYLHTARREQLSLITEDKSMQKKARTLGLDTFSIKDV